jgi:hypothetical protein
MDTSRTHGSAVETTRSATSAATSERFIRDHCCADDRRCREGYE